MTVCSCCHLPMATSTHTLLGQPVCSICFNEWSDREQTAAREALNWREAAKRAEERAADMEARALRAETTLADLTAWLRQGNTGHGLGLA